MIVKCEPKYLISMITLGREMLAESRFKKFNYDNNKIISLLTSPNCYAVLAINETNNAPYGFFVGIISEQWFGRDLAGYDLAMYIRPEYRGGMTAIRMIKGFEQFCRENNCVDINVGSSAEITTELVDKLYGKLGYSKCGFVAHKEI